MNIETLRRQVEADPSDIGAKIALVKYKARVEGGGVYLECLADRELWNKTDKQIKDMAIKEVERRLGDGYVKSGVTLWMCVNGEEDCDVYECHNGVIEGNPCDNCQGHGTQFKMVSHRLATFTHKGTGIEFQLLPGHRCYLEMIGEGHFPDKSHEPIKPFLIARWPVTRDQFRNFTTVKAPILGGLSLPVTDRIFEGVSSIVEIEKMRLPNAAEWEYACRAGTTTRFYWGDEFNPLHCWYAENSGGCKFCNGNTFMGVCPHCEHQPRPHSPKEHDDAGKFNAFGLVDMLGNVWEWLANEDAAGYSHTLTEETFSRTETIAINLGFEADLSVIGLRPCVSIPGLE